MSVLNKKLTISIPILVVIIVSVVVAAILINNRKPDTDPNLNPTNSQTETAKMDKIYATINGERLEIELEDNSTVSALLKELPLEVSMSDLNSNEKYVYLDNSLPTNTYSPKHIEAGDVMLFGDNCLVIFYKSFDTSYSYTKIGHIDNLPNLGDGSVSVAFSAE
ncbi:hypothetical protein IKX73_00645 [Candidatus Saccharibacteria bacterium]|nr:hypothetical protein [Candidatus Saccharibacteria bacterium]